MGPWGRRRRGTCSPARSRERTVGAQECTQIGENGLSTPFWGICVHCCVAGVARADGGGAGVCTDWRKWPLGIVSGHLCTLLRRGGRASGRGGAGVYTDWRKWPLGAVLGHLCTLLRRGGRASGRWGHNSVHRLAEMASRRRSGAFVYTVATPGCVGWRERRRREVGVFTEASTHTNPEESESNQCFFVGEER